MDGGFPSNLCESFLIHSAANNRDAVVLGWWNWQTRTFEGRMAKAVGVQIPPRAPILKHQLKRKFNGQGTEEQSRQTTNVGMNLDG